MDRKIYFYGKDLDEMTRDELIEVIRFQLESSSHELEESNRKRSFLFEILKNVNAIN